MGVRVADRVRRLAIRRNCRMRAVPQTRTMTAPITAEKSRATPRGR